MSEYVSITAKREYCSHCGGELSSYRTLVPLLSANGTYGPDYAAVHPACADAFRRKQEPKPMSDTSAGGRGP